MRDHLHVAFCGLCLMLVANAAHAQARVTVVNQSQREMTVKVMRISGEMHNLYGTMSVAPMGNQMMIFDAPGEYFIKTMAALSGRDPIYERGEPFTVGSDAHKILTITLTVQEPKSPRVTERKQISKEEFDKDSLSGK